VGTSDDDQDVGDEGHTRCQDHAQSGQDDPAVLVVVRLPLGDLSIEELAAGRIWGILSLPSIVHIIYAMVDIQPNYHLNLQLTTKCKFLPTPTSSPFVSHPTSKLCMLYHQCYVCCAIKHHCLGGPPIPAPFSLSSLAAAPPAPSSTSAARQRPAGRCSLS